MEIIEVIFLEEYRIKSIFKDGKETITDFKKFLFKNQNPMNTQFRDIDKFKKVYIEHGHLTWENGQMDISAPSIYNELI